MYMDAITIIQLLLALLGAAVLSCWLAYQSTVVQDIKTLIGLGAENDYTKYKWKWWFLPIALIWLELRELLNCPYCIGYHLGWITCYFMFDITIWQSLLYGALVIVFVELYRKLTI